MTLKIMIVILCFAVIILSIIGIEREKAYKKLANEWAKDRVEKIAQTGRIRMLNEKCDELTAECADLKALVERMKRPLAIENLEHREAESKAEKAEKKLDEKHKDLLAAEKRAKEAQTELQELKDKLAAEAEKHREELEKVKAEAQKPADSGDKQSFKHAYAASYKELTGLLEIIDSTDDKQERQIFTAKTEQLLALVGEKLRSLEEE